MNVSMNPKHDQKTRPDKPSAPAPSRRRRKAFNDRLAERPELFEEFEAILGLASGGEEGGRILSADEVEARLVAAVRKLGNRTMQQWAQEGSRGRWNAASKRSPECGSKKSPLSWWCAFGEVRIEEMILRTGRIHWMRPFAELAGVSGRCKSLRLQRAMCDFGVEHSFDSASQRLSEHYGFELGASAFREVTLQSAARAEQMMRGEYARPFRELPASAPETIIAEADGS